MTNKDGLIPVMVIICIACAGLLATGGLATYLVTGKSTIAILGIGFVAGVIFAPSIMTIIYKWMNRDEKK